MRRVSGVDEYPSFVRRLLEGSQIPSSRFESSGPPSGDYPHLLHPHIWVAQVLDNGVFGCEKQVQTSKMRQNPAIFRLVGNHQPPCLDNGLQKHRIWGPFLFYPIFSPFNAVI